MLSPEIVPPDSGIAKSNFPSFSDFKINISPDQPITAVAAEVAAYVNYVCPVKGAQAEMEKIAPELATSEYIFPTEKTASRLNVFRSLTPDEETKWSEAFQQAQGN